MPYFVEQVSNFREEFGRIYLLKNSGLLDIEDMTCEFI